MTTNISQVPSTPGVYVVFDENTNMFHYVYGHYRVEGNRNYGSTTAPTHELGSEFSMNSNSHSDAVPVPSCGTYANNGCWYPLAPIIVPYQAQSEMNLPIYPVYANNIQMFGSNVVPPQNICGEAFQNPQLRFQMPAAAGPRIQNTSNYFFCPQAADTTIVRPSAPTEVPHLGLENAAVEQLGVMNTGPEPTLVQYHAPEKAMLALAPMQYNVRGNLVKSIGHDRLPAHLKNIFNISSFIELLYRQLKGVNVPNGRPTLLTPFATYRSPGLEIVWKKHFALLFGLLEGQWQLEPTDEAPKDGFTVFRDMAKVRFSCQFCFRGWTSMFGVVMFFYRWNATDRRGVVRFLLMGQSCNKCVKDVFETPMWYPEEAQKVMTNLFYDVSSRVYGQLVPPFNRDRRHGRPRHQHIAQQCQGCVLHLCKPKKKPTNSLESEDSVAKDRKNRSLLASSSEKVESSDNGPGNCTTPDGLCRGVTALVGSGQNKSRRKFYCEESQDTNGNQQNLAYYSTNIYRQVEVGDAAEGSDADDDVERDPLVVAAIADVKKSLAERSSYLKCRNTN